MTRLLFFLCAAAAIAARFMPRDTFRATEANATTTVTAAPPEQVVIDGKFYPKNARGVYMVNGVATFVKKENVAAVEPAAPVVARPHEKIVEPSSLDHLIQAPGSN